MNKLEAPSAFSFQAQTLVESEFFWIESAATVEDGHAETWFFHRNADIDRFLAVSHGVRGDLRSQEVRCIDIDLDIEAPQGLREEEPSLRRRPGASTKLL